MLTRKKMENADPLQVQRGGNKAKKADIGPSKEIGSKIGGAKMKKGVPGQRRAAFGDLTNDTKTKLLDGKKGIPVAVKPAGKPVTTAAAGTKIARLVKTSKKEVVKKVAPKQDQSSSQSSSDSLLSSQESQNQLNLATGIPEDRLEEDFSFIEETLEDPKEDLLAIDEEHYLDVFNVGIYAQGIFDYYKRREKMFRLPQYLGTPNCRITVTMRTILVDWLVEIQENFELNHETLYLAVKLCDMYLSRVRTDKESLQLVGAASIFIASKFDERCPPLIEDFTYVCDNAFTREQFIEMEMEILRTIDFDLGIPISYRFLRRYAKVAKVSMETLTLARFILEMSLMQHELITESDSKIAAATLYIAMKMMKEGAWEGDVVKSCGYSRRDLTELIVKLNAMLRAPPMSQVNAIRGKYSHIVFHEVAKIPPLPTSDLL